MVKIGKNGQMLAFSGSFLHNTSLDLHEILCSGVSHDYLKTFLSDQIDLMILLTQYFKKLKNCQIICWCPFSPPGGGVLTPKLWEPLDLSYWGDYFDTLESQIRQMVLELLPVDQNSYKWTNGSTNSSPI